MITNNLENCSDALKNGEVILYPSDTLWALGCDATNNEGCQKIIDLKHRTNHNGFVVLVDSVRMLEHYVPDFHQVCYDLIDFADKPLTIVYPTAPQLAKLALANDGSVAIRITKDPNCLSLIRSIRKPIVSTSANLSGQPIPGEFGEISPEIIKQVKGIFKDRTNERLVKPSQIIKISLSGEVAVLRN